MEIIPVDAGVWGREGLCAQGARLCGVEGSAVRAHGSFSPLGGFGSLLMESARCVFCRVKSREDGG